MRHRTLRATAALALSLLGLAACKDATLGPQTLGTVQGTVRDFETGAPLGSAGVSTTPPSNAIVTDENGAFSIEGLATGNYTITANRQGYTPNSVTVAVREDQTTQAIIQLRKDLSGTGAGLVAEVTSFTNRLRADTATVDIEYRIRNTGTSEIPNYEVYFKISGAQQTYFAELKGTKLGAGQADVGTLRKSVGTDRAQTVVVDGTWVEGQNRPAVTRK